MEKIIQTLASFAKSVRTPLTFAGLVITALVAITMFLFSQGSWDVTLANLTSEQSFILLFSGLVGILTIIVILIILSFSYGRSTVDDRVAGYPFFVIVHQDGDKANVINDASVKLMTIPSAQNETTNQDGMARFFFQKQLSGKKVSLNAQKAGFKPRTTSVKLEDSRQVFISLTSDETASGLPTFDNSNDKDSHSREANANVVDLRGADFRNAKNPTITGSVKNITIESKNSDTSS